MSGTTAIRVTVSTFGITARQRSGTSALMWPVAMPATGTAALQATLIYERHEALAGQAAQSIAAFASLHVSVVFTAALIAQLLHLPRLLRVALWTFLGLTILATLYFGWHYVADDIAGVAIALVSFYVGGWASHQSFARHRRSEEPAPERVTTM